MPGHQDGAFRERLQVFEVAHLKRRSGADAVAGHRPARRQEGVTGDQGGGFYLPFCRGLEVQGPGLQDEQAALLVQGPFDVLGDAIVLFELHGTGGQGLDLFGGKTGGLLALGRHRDFLHPAPGAVHQLDGFGVDDRFQNGQIGVFGDPVGVRGQDPIHHVGAQPPNRVDNDGFLHDEDGVAGIHDAAGIRVDHLEAGHTHGDVLVPDALHQAVGDGPGGVEAGQHRLVAFQKIFRSDIQGGEVLAGKGQLAVLADGAAPERYPGRGIALVRGLRPSGCRPPGWPPPGEGGSSPTLIIAWMSRLAS